MPLRRLLSTVLLTCAANAPASAVNMAIKNMSKRAIKYARDQEILTNGLSSKQYMYSTVITLMLVCERKQPAVILMRC
jgi:hypothetical protein